MTFERPRCLICGAAHITCVNPRKRTTGRKATMTKDRDLDVYEVEVEHGKKAHLKMTAEEAKAQGGVLVNAPGTVRGSEDPSPLEEDPKPTAKAAKPANKARAADTKAD